MTPQPRPARTFEDLWGWGERLTWVSGLVLAISAFTGWYVGSGEGPTTSVIGWHTGALGKLVFFIGLAVLAARRPARSGDRAAGDTSRRA